MRTDRLRIVFTARLLSLLALPAHAFSDEELIDGFQRTVFGSEYQSFGWQSFLVKKFTDRSRVFVDDRSAARRGKRGRALRGRAAGI